MRRVVAACDAARNRLIPMVSAGPSATRMRANVRHGPSGTGSNDAPSGVDGAERWVGDSGQRPVELPGPQEPHEQNFACSSLAPAIFDVGFGAPGRLAPIDSHLQSTSTLALYHLDACIKVSMNANRRQLFSVTLCMIRQCVEVLSIVELGLQRQPFQGDRLM